MIGFGIVTFIGIILEPIMKPIFRVPGAGGFVFVMGLISGFPAGAKITARLYEENKLTKTEAERLSSFTNFSNPLFIFGVTAIGFFHNASLGIIFALSHYFGNLCVGVLMRFYKPHDKEQAIKKKRGSFLVLNALEQMHIERMARRKPIGKMLGDAVHSSVSTLLVIGGFIVLFSVLYQLLKQIYVTSLMDNILNPLLVFLGFSPHLGTSIVPGIFEMTIGAKEVSGAEAPLIERVMFVSGLLGFCGFSIQAQATSILAEVGLSPKPFLVGRLFHSFFSCIFAYMLFKSFHIEKSLQTEQVLSYLSEQASFEWPAYFRYGSLITLCSLIIFIFVKTYRVLSRNSR
ncbi:sporulation integral membrane protein YlbJ [Terrilactibacillus sp. S3-3]|nr:sporulation integral membrane protein YlbJ [Terrilactibacillus sp. S3-3]